MTRLATLSRRDLDILTALVRKVRLFSLRQISNHWWHGDLANTRRRMKTLVASGLLNTVDVPARSLPALCEPYIDWRPGTVTPHFGHVAHRLSARWHWRALRPTRVFVGTPRAANLLGGTARGNLKCSTQATHDLGVSAVWLWLVNQNPAWAVAWQGEDVMAETRRGEKLPDAFIVSRNSEITHVIEFGGTYNANRVKAFHEDCVQRALPYQLW